MAQQVSPTSPEIRPISSKEMLGHMTVVVTPLLVLTQAVVLIWFRWVNVKMDVYLGPSIMAWTINPWVVWIAAAVLMLAILWWRACRMVRSGWHLPLLASCLFISINLAVAGLVMEPPASESVHTRPRPDEDRALPSLDIPGYEPVIPFFDRR